MIKNEEIMKEKSHYLMQRKKKAKNKEHNDRYT